MVRQLQTSLRPELNITRLTLPERIFFAQRLDARMPTCRMGRAGDQKCCWRCHRIAARMWMHLYTADRFAKDEPREQLMKSI
ncbi:protein of unknown function (plasmid) [Cupriavidus taiwanensis]|uniref:Uncharacterized protein n=1 Tax=Cupriavidus taiwanensis TaxID=164546 RepID=A0A9Q7XQF1_9BURK|nr:protein of unknown function [Cupriavidus taiwanensis]